MFLKGILLGVFFVLVAAVPARAISDVCEDECSPLVDRGLFTCRHKCMDSQSDSGGTTQQQLPTGLYFLNYKVQTRLKTPVLKNAKATPDPAQPGQPFRISLEFENVDPSDPPLVTVFYTFAEATGTWHAAAAGFDSGDEVFSTFLPIPADAETVRWFVRAVSPDDNAYTEIPCQVSEFPFEENDCLAPLTAENTYADYENFTVDPRLDITKTRAGYDDDSMYFEIQTAAPPTVTDLFRNEMTVYYIGVYNPAKWSRVEPLGNVVFLYYVPWPDNDMFCLLIKRMGGEWQASSGGITCHMQDNRIQMRVSGKMLPGDWTQGLHVFAGSSLNSYSNNVRFDRDMVSADDSAIIVDYTGATGLLPMERVVQVQKQTVDLE